ncbi:MAG: hypothetical protein RIQ81_918 [Pseudomonadota bacterium]
MTAARFLTICSQVLLPIFRAPHITFLICSVFLSSCGDDEDNRPERISKLRAIGVASSPLVGSAPAPGATTQVELTAYAALPKGQTVTATSFIDDDARYATPVVVQVNNNSQTVESKAALDIYSVKATATIGPLTELQQAQLAISGGKLLFRYGIRLEAGDESEDIVGNILVYPPGAEALTYQPIDVTINEPTINATLGTGPDQPLVGDVIKAQQENVKVSWFVSSGKVKNRRARDTKWEPVVAGPQTVILTARGLASGSFVMKVADIVVE